MKYIDSMFDNDGVPDQWTAQEKLDHFQHIIFRLTEENSCIMDKTQESLDDFLSREASLRAYFDKIATVLKEKSQHHNRQTKTLFIDLGFNVMADQCKPHVKQLGLVHWCSSVVALQGFQYCAWEFARKEILRALQFILKEDFHSTWPRQDSGTKHEFLK
ncbi:hypothetical protein MHYP_G00305840 [Metynnis hypsauchen]